MVSVIKKRKLIVLIAFGLIMLVLGLICDILIKLEIMKDYLIVSENYIFYLFSLIFTVATLGCTLLSIIVGVSGNRVLGLQLREVVSLTNSPLQLKAMIVESLLIVGVSIPALAFEMYTSITMLALYLVFFMIYHTVILCMIVFNKEFIKENIKLYLKESYNIKSSYIQCWITALYRTMEENDIASEEEYLALLNSAAQAHTQYCDQIEKQIPQLFATSCLSQSFTDSYIRILRLNDSNNVLFDERTITFNYVKNIMYANPKAVYELNFPGTIDSIIMCDFLSEDNKSTYCYWYINALLNNNSLKNDEKLNIVYNGLCRLMWLRDDVSFSNVRVNIALSLFRENILKAKDFDFGKEIYKIFIKAMYKENIYHSAKPLASLLSQMVRMIYFWAFMEKETLSEERRNLISTIPSCKVDTIDNASLSIQTLINWNHEKMLEYLIFDAFQPERFDPLDYWPEIHNGKTIVCSSENKIKFAFWFYLVWGYHFYSFPIEKYIVTDTRENQIMSKILCVSVREEFDEENKSIKQNTIEHISLLQTLFNKNYLLPKQYLVGSYDAVNKQILQINQLQYNSHFDSDTKEIIDQLYKSVIDDPEITMDDSISLESAVTCQLPPILCSNTTDYCSHIVYIIKKYFTEIVNNILKRRLPKVKLTFDSEGVKRLKSELEKEKYTYRNYTFYDDWGLKKEAREIPEYAELIKLVNDINEKRNNNLYEYLFLKVDDVNFNYSIESMTIEELEGEVLEEYLSQYRVSGGQYDIDGGVYNKITAKEHFMKTRFLLQSIIKIETNVTTTSGFRVVFKDNSK